MSEQFVRVDIVRIIVLDGTQGQGLQHIAINQDGLAAMMWAIKLERMLLLELAVLLATARHFVPDMKLE